LLTLITVDVLVVSLISAIPISLAMLMKAHVHLGGRDASVVGTALVVAITIGLAALAMTIEGALIRDIVPRATGRALSMPALVVFRSIFSIACCFAVLLVMSRFCLGWVVSRMQAASGAHDWRAFLISLAIAFVLPAVYIVARCEFGWRRFEELRQSVRLGEARRELASIRGLIPDATHHEKTVAEWLFELEVELNQIEETRRQLPHPPTGTDVVLQQSRLLAILGEPDLAMGYLQQYPEAFTTAEGNLLIASIQESRSEYRLAIDRYVDAQRILGRPQGAPDSIAPSYLTAVRGEAFCRRKGGDVRGAQHAYHKLFELAPSSENALLLAYFYEDTQQTVQADQWLRRAVQLDPSLQQEAARLRRKMANTHFGCFQIRQTLR
jgi:tetratricopeptide (TPR) repeat protein